MTHTPRPNRKPTMPNGVVAAPPPQSVMATTQPLPPGLRPAQYPQPSRRLQRREAATYLGVSLSWLDKSRMTGTGPVYITIGNRVVYDQTDLDAFLAGNRRISVSG